VLGSSDEVLPRVAARMAAAAGAPPPARLRPPLAAAPARRPSQVPTLRPVLH